jgi:ubiquinone/menaquinone biosynthesis C-methylase UbiE
MDSRLQRRVQRYGWDKAAAYYEEYWARQLEAAQHRMLAMAAIQEGERVIDIACGTGLVTFRAAESTGPRGMVVATDISDAMVGRVTALAAERGMPYVTAERSDAEEIGQRDGSFDVALCALGLMYVPDPLRALEQMHRVLRAEGRLAVAVWGQRSRCGWAEIFPIVERRVASEVCPLFFQLGGGDALQYALKRTGYSAIAVERMETTLSYTSGESACGAAFAGGPVALPYSRFDPATRDEVHAEYLASIAEYRRGDGYEVPGEFVIARAAK